MTVDRTPHTHAFISPIAFGPDRDLLPPGRREGDRPLLRLSPLLPVMRFVSTVSPLATTFVPAHFMAVLVSRGRPSSRRGTPATLALITAMYLSPPPYNVNTFTTTVSRPTS